MRAAEVYKQIKIESGKPIFVLSDCKKYIRLKWNIILHYKNRTLLSPFNTGFINYKVAWGVSHYLYGNSSFAPSVTEKTMFSVPDTRLMERVEGIIRTALLGPGAGANWGREANFLTTRGIKIEPPTVETVLYCLCSDASALNEGSFENWASSLGYDPDSKTAEKIYNACLKEAADLSFLFGRDCSLSEMIELVYEIDNSGGLEEAIESIAERDKPDIDQLLSRQHSLVAEGWKLVEAEALALLKKYPDHLTEWAYAMGSGSFSTTWGEHLSNMTHESDLEFGSEYEDDQGNIVSRWDDAPSLKEDLREFFEEVYSKVETELGNGSPVRFKADGIRRTDW